MDVLYTNIAILVTVGAALVGVVFMRRRRTSRRIEATAARLAAMRRAWAKPVTRERESSPHQLLMTLRRSDCPSIDSRTWNDLNLDNVFAFIDRTHTTPGELQLHAMLKSPVISCDVLKRRDDQVTVFESDCDVREQVVTELSQLPHISYADEVIELLWGDISLPSSFAWLYKKIALTIAVLLGASAALLTAGFSVNILLLLLIVFYLGNLPIHYRTRARFGYQLRAIRYVCKMIMVGRNLASKELPGLEEVKADLGRLYSLVASIPKVSASIVPERSGVQEIGALIQEYFAIMLLAEVRAFSRVLKEIHAQRKSLQAMFMAIGDLDAFQAVASFREELPIYSKPTLHSGSKAIMVNAAFHPLLNDAVSNSISLGEKGALITGSNMSGKSTFLRTIGITALLAQTIYTCPAESYQASFFHVMTSMSIADNLMRGESYYLVEAKRLLEIIRGTERTVPTLALIDEILRGTNTAERVAASSEILLHFSKLNGLVIAASHEVDMVNSLSHVFDRFHFDASVDDAGIRFDYKLREGSEHTQNAIALLRLLDFPPEIVNGAARRM